MIGSLEECDRLFEKLHRTRVVFLLDSYERASLEAVLPQLDCQRILVDLFQKAKSKLIVDIVECLYHAARQVAVQVVCHNTPIPSAKISAPNPRSSACHSSHFSHVGQNLRLQRV